MEYQEYIDLGFIRKEMNCGVEFKQTGYYGFALEKEVNKRQMICVISGELDKPKLYIKKRNNKIYHIISIPTEAVIDLCMNYEEGIYENL
jgi:hypothetical protein